MYHSCLAFKRQCAVNKRQRNQCSLIFFFHYTSLCVTESLATRLVYFPIATLECSLPSNWNLGPLCISWDVKLYPSNQSGPFDMEPFTLTLFPKSLKSNGHDMWHLAKGNYHMMDKISTPHVLRACQHTENGWNLWFLYQKYVDLKWDLRVSSLWTNFMYCSRSVCSYKNEYSIQIAQGGNPLF